MRPRATSVLPLLFTTALALGACGDDDAAQGCPSPLATCDDTCTDLASSLEHCGACGNSCDPGLFCSAGVCKDACDASLTRCDDSCFDTQSDPFNCGACGNECAAGELCSLGQCGIACLGGTTECGGICTVLEFDPRNCGACDVTCGADEQCIDGGCVLGCAAPEITCDDACVDTSSDEDNCGDCGVTCGATQVCVESGCVDATPLALLRTVSYDGAIGRDLLLVNEYDYGSHVTLNATSFDSETVKDYVIGPTGDVIFLGAQDAEGVNELYLLPANGAPQIKLSQALVTGGEVTHFQLSTDGGRVVYRADAEVDERFELYTVVLAMPGVAAKLNGSLVADGDVTTSFVLSADGSRVAYIGTQDDPSLAEVYTTPVSNPVSNAKVNAPLTQSAAITELAIDLDGSSFLYIYDHDTLGVPELYTVALSSLGTANKVNAPLTEGGCHSGAFTPDGTRAVYLMGDDPFAGALFTTALASLGTSTELSQTFEAGEGVYDFTVLSDATGVMYRARADEQSDALFQVSFSSPGTPTKLSADDHGAVYAYRISGDASAVVYAADTYGELEIGGDPNDGSSVLVHVDLANPSVKTRLTYDLGLFGHLSSQFDVADDGSRVFYIAEQDGEGFSTGAHAYMVEVADPHGAIDLSPPLRTFDSTVLGAESNPAGTKAYYVGDYEVDDRYDIYEVDVASGVSTLVHPPLAPPAVLWDARLSPDGTKAVYSGDADTLGKRELFFVDTGNLGVAIKLNGAMVATGDVRDFAIAPDSSGVLYVADQNVDGQDDLYWVTFANPGVSTLVSTNLAAVPDADVSAYAVASDASFAVFTADAVYDNERALFITALPSGTVTQLSTDVATSSVDDFVIAHDDSFIVYRADETTNGQEELFKVDALLVNPTPAVPLSPSLVNGSADVNSGYALSPDDSTIFYVAEGDQNGQKELYYVDFVNALSGQLGADPPSTSSSYDVYDFVLSPDGAHVVMRANHSNVNRTELWYIDLANPTVSTKVNEPSTSSSTDVFGGYAISPTNDGVAYVGDLLIASTTEVFYTAFDTLGTSTRVHGALGSSQDMSSLSMMPNGDILLIGDALVDKTELFVADHDALGTVRRLSTPWQATDVVDIKAF